jgi:hypothetical protein
MKKHLLLRNEIEMLQLILQDKVFPSPKCRIELVVKLEDLKKKWYKVKEKQEEKK